MVVVRILNGDHPRAERTNQMLKHASAEECSENLRKSNPKEKKGSWLTLATILRLQGKRVYNTRYEAGKLNLQTTPG